MKGWRRRGLEVGLLCTVVGVVVLAVPGPQSPRASEAPQRTLFRKTRADVTWLGRYPREEWYVRDVYARLMRYDFAARQVRQRESGEASAPEAYLTVAVRALRTWDTAAVPADESAAVDAHGMVVALSRTARCHKDDPCHAVYEAAWGDRAGPDGTASEVRTFAGPVTRVTAYDVTLTLGGQNLDYTAQVRYHEAGDGVGVEPEVVDPVIPGLQQVVDDDAPLVVAPWARYVKTRRYAAVVKRIMDLRRAGKRAVPDGAPIGSLPGDDVTAQQEAMVMMATGEPCGPGCDVCAPLRKTAALSRSKTYNLAELGARTDPYFRWFKQALASWNTAGQGRLSLVGQLSSGQVPVVLWPTDPIGGPYGLHRQGTIYLFPRLFAREDAFIQHTMKHEIGHSIGFDEVPGGGGWNQQQRDRCDCYTSIMWMYNDCYLNYLTENDICAIEKYTR
jgi:hypothetical protein